MVVFTLRKRTNRLIFVRLVRRFLQDDFFIQKENSMIVRHKFKSDNQMVNFLAAGKWD